MNHSNGWAALLTPPLPGAVSIWALRGSGVWRALAPLCKPVHGSDFSPSVLPASTRLARLAMPGNQHGDEVLVVPRSTNPVPHIEIHGHSGPELLRWHSEIWRAAGIQLCSWQAFEIWQARDRLAGESLQALAKTTTRRGANGVLVQQTRVRTAIQQVMTLIRAGESSQAFGLLESMVAGHRVARAWTTPWRVALCGKPNAGKSSLLNALTGSTRAIVSAIPGTTRDVVRGTTAIDGWLVEFSDTAGLRESDDILEQAGMNAGKTVAKQADLVLWLTEDIDQSGIPHATDQIVVHTKSDIRPSSLSHAHAVDVSAVSGQGIDALLQLIVDKLAGNANLLAGAVAFSSALERSCQRAILDLSHNRTEEALTEIGTWLNSGPEPVESSFP